LSVKEKDSNIYTSLRVRVDKVNAGSFNPLNMAKSGHGKLRTISSLKKHEI